MNPDVARNRRRLESVNTWPSGRPDQVCLARICRGEKCTQIKGGSYGSKTASRESLLVGRLVGPSAFDRGAETPTQTMRPVIRGRQAAVSSMKAEATEAARRVLAEGGNAFDAIVGGPGRAGSGGFPLERCRQ